jgi:general secretion pathway protein M
MSLFKPSFAIKLPGLQILRVPWAGKTFSLNKEDLGKPASAVLVLFLIYSLSLVALWLAADTRATLQTSYDVKHDLLASLEARRANLSRRRVAQDHADPFVRAVTETLAAAELDDRLRQIAAEENGVVLSSHAEVNHEDEAAGHKIEIKALLEGKIEMLQALLFRLETGSPLIFVDDLHLEIKDEIAQKSEGGAPTLRTALTLVAYWRPPAPLPASQ